MRLTELIDHDQRAEYDWQARQIKAAERALAKARGKNDEPLEHSRASRA